MCRLNNCFCRSASELPEPDLRRAPPPVILPPNVPVSPWSNLTDAKEDAWLKSDVATNAFRVAGHLALRR